MTARSQERPPVSMTPVSRLNVEFAVAGPWLVAKLRGELDLGTVPPLLDQVGRLINRQAAPRIALDLARVTSCDAAGINAFVRLFKRAVIAGGELVLLRPAPRMAELLASTGADRCVRVRETPPEDDSADRSRLG